MVCAVVREFAKTMRFCRTALILAVISALFQGCGPEREQSRASGPETVARKFADAVLGARFDDAGECVRGKRMSNMLDGVKMNREEIKEHTVFRPAGVRIEGDQAVVQLEFNERKQVWYGVYFLRNMGCDGWKITDVSGGRAPMVLDSVEGCREEALRRIRKAIRKSVEKSAAESPDGQP